MQEKLETSKTLSKRAQLPVYRFYFKEADVISPQLQTSFSVSLGNNGINARDFIAKEFEKTVLMYHECNKKRWPIEIQRIATWTACAMIIYGFVGIAGGEFIPENIFRTCFPLWATILGVIAPWILLGYLTTREDNRSAWKAMSKANDEFVEQQLILERKLSYKNIRTIFGEDFKGAFVEFIFPKQQKSL
jgi:hypothetical protein